jgi:UDP-N-acetylglucosamine 2-epimerase
VNIIPPAGYLAMLTLVRNARAVLTDSGGLQKEAIWLGRPCITLRDETEWIETLERGWNTLAGTDPDQIVRAAVTPPEPPAPEFASPGASRRIVDILLAG